jgi:hypothetical protein
MTSFRVLLDNVQDVDDGLIYTTYPGFAAADVALTALFDVQIEPEGITDRDLDMWDAAFYACGASAGEFPWVASSNASKRREYWLWYLEEYLTIAGQSTAEALK